MKRVIPIIIAAFALTAQGAQYIGNPNPGNGWDTTSAVSINVSNDKPGREMINAINGSGLSGAQGQKHTNDIFGPSPGNTTMGFISGGGPGDRWGGGGTIGAYWAEFAFDQAYDVSNVHIWNYNESASGPNPDPNGTWSMQGMKEITIYYTTTGNGGGFGSDTEGDWSVWGTHVLTRASGGPDVLAEIVALNQTAQYVLFLGANPPEANFMNDFGITATSTEGALSEVRFEIVPEPATLALLGLGGLAMFLRRRR